MAATPAPSTSTDAPPASSTGVVLPSPSSAAEEEARAGVAAARDGSVGSVAD
ncbi:hypothetical protein ACFQ10_04345 [Streptomyces indonesiensis]